MTRLYICLKNPLSQRDLKRFNIAFLDVHFDLVILDCTPWLLPTALLTRAEDLIQHPRTVTICSHAQLRNAVDLPGYALDFVGQFSYQSLLLFNTLVRRNVQIVVLDSGPFPAPLVPSGSFSRRKYIRRFLSASKLLRHILLKILPNQSPYLALVSGSEWKKNPRFSLARNIVESHSFDYERILELSTQSSSSSCIPPQPYAVYLDEKIAYHEDNVELSLPNPATPSSFYPTLCRYLETLQNHYGIRIVVASYPSSKLEPTKYLPFQHFSYFTPELVRHSCLVLAHASTAISFAVVWRKPIYFLTSNELLSSWYQPWIDAPRTLLNAPLINVDSPHFPVAPFSIDIKAYSQYQESFIKSDTSPNTSLWKTLADSIPRAPQSSI